MCIRDRSGKWEFGKVHATETTVEGVTVELTTADGVYVLPVSVAL